jgi:hypothetical protein
MGSAFFVGNIGNRYNNVNIFFRKGEVALKAPLRLYKTNLQPFTS